MKIAISCLALLLVAPHDGMLSTAASHEKQVVSSFVSTPKSFIRRGLQEGPMTAPSTEEDEPSIEEEKEEPSVESMDSDEEKGRVSIPKARECETESGALSVSHECKAKTEGLESEIEDEIDFEVKASDDGICMEVKYKQEIEETLVETETKAKFEVCFQQLIEYTKAQGSTIDEAYDWVADETLQTIDLTTWDDFSEVLTDPINGLSTFTATSADQTITMTFTISPAGDEERITANTMKADVRIVDFPWTPGANSYVALLSDVESKLKVDVDQEEPEELDDVEEAGEMPEQDEQEAATATTEPTEEEPEENAEPTEAEPTEEEPEPTIVQPDTVPTEMNGGGALRRVLDDDKKTKKPKDFVIDFADVLDTVGFSVLGKVTWADTAVAATDASETDTVAVGRAEKIIKVVATSPPQRVDDARYLVTEGSGKMSQQVAFSFTGDGAQGSPDIFWDPEAGVAYDVESSTTSGALEMSLGIIVSGFVTTFALVFAL